MKSKPLSVGKLFLPAVIALAACSIATKDRGQESSEAAPQSALAGEVSLVQDQKSIEELRKDIPEPIKSDNELLRETLALLGEVKDHPSKHRERFDKLIRKIRNDHQKESRRNREEFSRGEKTKREAFYSKMKDDRKDFLDDKPEKEKRKKFIDDQDRKRNEYRADERDRRGEFDGEYRDQERDFSAMVRDKTSEFYNELRLYEKRYAEWKKNEAAAKASAPQSSPTNFEPLKSGD